MHLQRRVFHLLKYGTPFVLLFYHISHVVVSCIHVALKCQYADEFLCEHFKYLGDL